MENRAYALLAGLFVTLLAIGVVAAIVWFSGDTVQRVDYVLVSNGSVAGLNPKAPVRLRGVEVGNVEDIRFDRKNPRDILITIAVDRDAPITRGTYAQLGFLGVTGLSYVQLEDDGSKPQRLAPFSRIDVRPSLLDEAATSAQQLLAEANSAAKRINMLLSDRNLARISRALDNVQLATVKVGQASDAIAYDVSRESHMLDQVLKELHDHPQSLVFGRQPPPPGPGEPGFDSRRGDR